MSQGIPYLDWQFLQSLPSRKPEKAGVYSSSKWINLDDVVVAPVSTNIRCGSAIYLEEYAKKNKFTDFIQMNIS